MLLLQQRDLAHRTVGLGGAALALPAASRAALLPSRALGSCCGVRTPLMAKLCWLMVHLGQRRSTVWIGKTYNSNVCNICAATLGNDGDIEFKQMLRTLAQK